MRGLRPPVTVGPTIVGVIVTSLVMAALVLSGCGADGSAERPFEPTLPSVDFRPKLVLVVRDDALGAEPGERADPAVRTDPPTVPSGSVVEVRNDGPATTAGCGAPRRSTPGSCAPASAPPSWSPIRVPIRSTWRSSTATVPGATCASSRRRRPDRPVM